MAHSRYRDTRKIRRYPQTTHGSLTTLKTETQVGKPDWRPAEINVRTDWCQDAEPHYHQKASNINKLKLCGLWRIVYRSESHCVEFLPCAIPLTMRRLGSYHPTWRGLEMSDSPCRQTCQQTWATVPPVDRVEGISLLPAE